MTGGAATGRRRRLALVSLLACGMVGCGDASSPTTCSARSVGAIRVSAGLNPAIAWAAECEAQVLAVYDPASADPVWHLAADTRRIPKPVTYGTVPPGVRVLRTGAALRAGTSYAVYVAILVGTDTLASVGNFTP